ncbi:GH36-type glycosyl hydrolase domain-containing protein [uncultured Demequina sp.]|uniref:GH36-type glycosyl hydrolase domain-containing protein n=1 Tax=uncultured Demequina sp. TaxID=693499 RepID=UPI0025D66A02|nr:glycosyl hydrolase family 65 protein [uncultured Demequina sp.]
MQHGHFDDEAREYVITRPDTPRSWSNYLGSRLYGGIITQGAGGYSFYKSGGTGRVLRFRFNGVPQDEPGRFIYLRDDADGDFWSASWQPVGKPMRGRDGESDDTQAATVRHGLGYSIFESTYRGITSTATFFIPKDQAFEYWSVTVTNTTDRTRHVSLFSYAELANEWNYRQDLENLQYSQYVVVAKKRDGMISRANSTRTAWSKLWFGMAGADVASFDTDRDAFLGPYRTQSAPLAVERGECSGSECVGDNSCSSLHARLELAPGETRQVIYMLGMGDTDEPWDDSDGLTHRPGRETLAEYATPERVDAELAAIRDEWRDFLAPLQVATPDAEMNSMVNVWHAYQTHMTFNWSRGVSLIEAGDRDGLGYRDTVQDMLAVIHAIPEAVRERLDMILTGQTAEGGAMPLVKPLTHSPGSEETPTVSTYRSDDPLWLPITVANFVYETGDVSYLDQVLPYADHGEATVFEHLRQAIQFSLDHLGANGLVQGLQADWNDCIQFGTTGESMFSTFLMANGCRIVAELAEQTGRTEDAAWARGVLESLQPVLEGAWDGQWYIRGISATGAKLGSDALDEGKIYLEPNVWAAMSKVIPVERAIGAMDSVHERLSTEHGVALCAPAHTKEVPGVGLSLLVFPVGHKENGGIFCHANSWTIVAESVLGRGDRAYEYYRGYLPAKYNDAAEIHQVEPYVYCQFTHGPESPRFGQARNPWLTGTASWSYVGVTQGILGIRPELEGLRIDPCLPEGWGGFQVTRRFRGMDLTINVVNESGVATGVSSVTVEGFEVAADGDEARGALVPVEALKDGDVLTVTMG